MTKDEALKLALDALEVANSCVDGYYIPKGKTHLPEIELAITAIKESLAQPEQTTGNILMDSYKAMQSMKVEGPRHVVCQCDKCKAQPEQDEQCKRCTDGCPACDARKLPEQEPYCYTYTESGEEYFAPPTAYVPDNATPLYTTPPQRTWVGLTEKDICEAAVKSQEGISPRDDTLHFAIAIEAKLKEKNT